MMRFLHGLSGLVLFLVLALLGSSLIYVTLGGQDAWVALLTCLRAERYSVLGAAVSLLLLMLIFFLTSLRRKKPSQFISFEGRGGSVAISIKAVKDIIQKVADEFAAILGLHANLQVRGGAVDMTVDVRVRAGTHVPELCQMLQDRIRESISDNLGLSGIKTIKVNVREIVPADAPIEKREMSA